jgi:hypothetical protein
MVFKNFKEFYPYYLKEHNTIMCRRMHFLGTCGVIALLILFFFTGNLLVLALSPFTGYGLAWAGHFIFEKNTPMTFKHPLYSLGGDFKMFWDILWGRLKAF